MKTKNNFIQDLINSISEDYKFDLYEQRFIVSKGVRTSKYYINDTIELYSHYNDELDENFLNAVKSTLEDIVKNDIVISLDDKIILKELYKIIFLINSTNKALDFISSKNYPKKFLAGYQSDKKEIAKEAKKHKGMIVNSRVNIISKGEHRLNWWFHHILNMNPKLTKYYLNMFTLIDLEKCTFIEKEDEKVIEKFFNFLNSKTVQMTTENAILKNLSILLYDELKYFLKIEEKNIEPLITELMFKLYNYKPNYEEFNKVIYLRSTINYFPIFGAKRNTEFDKKEKNFIRSNILKDAELNNIKDFYYKSFDMTMELLFKKPHTQFLLKYPVEFFRKNPKYSTI